MAWRIASHVERGEIDNRVKGKITGTLWLAGCVQPVRLELRGVPWQDMAGRLLTFRNPKARPGIGEGFAVRQEGVCGDMTASRKVKVPEVPVAELAGMGRAYPYHWANSLYLEWFSKANGRVVIESFEFEMVLSEPAWAWSPEQDRLQRSLAREGWAAFFAGLDGAADSPEGGVEAVRGEGAIGGGAGTDGAARDCLGRIQELKEKVEKLAGGRFIHGGGGGVPPEVEEQFWRNVLEFETAPVMLRRQMLEKDGVSVRPSEEVPEAELREELWALIHALAHRRTFLGHTDHLSDRELYHLLVEEVLEEETSVLPPHSGWGCQILMDEYTGRTEEESEEIFLRFYASDRVRERWKADFPGAVLPPREEPPYERDSQLPRGDG